MAENKPGFWVVVKDYWSQIAVVFVVVGSTAGVYMEWRINAEVLSRFASEQIQEQINTMIDDKIAAVDLTPKIFIMDSERLVNRLGIEGNKENIEVNKEDVVRALEWIMSNGGRNSED